MASLPSLSAPRAETKAIHWPSGDHAGAVDGLVAARELGWRVPSASATQICETHSLFSPSMAAVATTKATRRPSGDGRTLVTRFTLNAKSGVQAATSLARSEVPDPSVRVAATPNTAREARDIGSS